MCTSVSQKMRTVVKKVYFPLKTPKFYILYFYYALSERLFFHLNFDEAPQKQLPELKESKVCSPPIS